MQQFLEIGQIVSSQGKNGEVRVKLLCKEMLSLCKSGELYFDEDTPVSAEITHVRNETITMRFIGTNTDEEARLLLDKKLYVRTEIETERGEIADTHLADDSENHQPFNDSINNVTEENIQVNYAYTEQWQRNDYSEFIVTSETIKKQCQTLIWLSFIEYCISFAVIVLFFCFLSIAYHYNRPMFWTIIITIVELPLFIGTVCLYNISKNYKKLFSFGLSSSYYILSLIPVANIISAFYLNSEVKMKLHERTTWQK